MNNDTTAALEQIDAVKSRLIEAKAMIARRIIGQEKVVDQTIMTVLCGGHGLLVGVPGVAKTLLVESLGTVLGLQGNRVQFTPDLMPADILGSEVLETADDGSRAFRFIKGPVFCQLLMADEINRASPRTQSALLQAMQEHHVTVAGQRFDLPEPFHVLATQNPIEQEGTYPLPEAQLDRFLMQIDVDYPSREDEKAIILATTGMDDSEISPVFNAESLIAAQQLIRKMPVGDSIVEMILNLVRSARPGEDGATDLVNKTVVWGPGPRAAQALMLAVRARALLTGRVAPSPDDVAELAHPILIHRMALGFAARAENISLNEVIADLTTRALGNEAAA
ncbi:MAG: MoxR family ATPase [Rhodobacteraceae bacterium]|nr:MoxR family ATPase [Paracoccaceae bacterium]